MWQSIGQLLGLAETAAVGPGDWWMIAFGWHQRPFSMASQDGTGLDLKARAIVRGTSLQFA
jgi:hypothetical protein